MVIESAPFDKRLFLLSDRMQKLQPTAFETAHPAHPVDFPPSVRPMHTPSRLYMLYKKAKALHKSILTNLAAWEWCKKYRDILSARPHPAVVQNLVSIWNPA